MIDAAQKIARVSQDDLPPDVLGSPIDSSVLKSVYRRSFGLDVERFFPKAEVVLKRNPSHSFYQFESAQPGDDRFYAELMGRIGYDDGEKAEFIAAAKFVATSKTVLDIGCGPGRFADYCKSAVYKGVELNPDAVAEARREGRNVVLEPMEDQPTSGFDVVTLFQVLEHVPSPEAFFAEAARCVADGGHLIVSTPDMDGHIGHETNHILNYPPHHLSWWSAKSISSMMQASGFEIVEVWREPLQPFHVHNWISSVINPRGQDHFVSTLRSRILSVVAKGVARLVTPFYRPVPYLTGQCVMVVGRRRA